MGAKLVSVSVIRREKMQFMYNFNRFVAFMPFFAQLKLWKQFTGKNAKSLMQFTYCELLPKSVPSHMFVLDTCIRFLLLTCLYPEIIIKSNYCCTLTLAIVRFIWCAKRWKCQTVSTNNKDLTIFSVKHDLYQLLLASYTQVVFLFS